MPFMRTHPRITDTQDLSARLSRSGYHYAARRVLNLSEGGMLIDGGEFAVGDLTSFELAGPGFRTAGLAEVTHRSPDVTGLHFLRWDELSGHEMRDMITTRVRHQQHHAARLASPGQYLG